MAVKYATQAFVFKKEDRLDADRIFFVFTKEFGRLEVFGKAIRRIDSKLRSGINIFSFSEIEFIQGKNKKTLTDARILQGCGTLADNPEKLFIANAISDMVHHFINGQEKDEKIWALLIETFGRLRLSKTRKLIYYYFFWNFIALLGHGADVEGMKISPQVLELLELINRKDWDTLEKLNISPDAKKSFEQISDSHYKRLIESYAQKSLY